MLVSSSAPSAVDFHNSCQLNESSENFNQFQLILKLLGGQYQIPGQQHPWMVGPLRTHRKKHHGFRCEERQVALVPLLMFPHTLGQVWLVAKLKGATVILLPKKTKFT